MNDLENTEKINLNDFERKVSLIGGGALLLYALKKGSLGSLLSAFMGVGLLMRGTSGHSRIYEILEYSSLEGPQAEKTARTEEKTTDLPQMPTSVVSESVEAETETAAKREKATTSTSAKLQDMSKEELYKKAQQQNIRGRTNMTKKQLIDALKGKV